MREKKETSIVLQKLITAGGGGDREVEFLTTLLSVLKKLREYNAKKWQRFVSVNNLLTDRWENAKFLNFGENTSIYDDVLVIGDVKVGKNTWIGPFVILDGSGGLEIGDYCSISAGVQIYTHNTVKWAISLGKEPYERKPVKIGNGVYIGPLTVISMGVNIGNQSIIGALSFVNRDIPSKSVAIGSPVRVKGKVEFDENGEPFIVWKDGEKN